MQRWMVPLLMLQTLAASHSLPGQSGSQLAIRDGYALLPAYVNGRGPFHMLIDTGASSCSLTPEAAAAAGLVLTNRVILETLGGERLVPAAAHSTVRVGTAESTAVEMLVLPIPGPHQVDRRIDGVIGQTFLSRRPYLIDYRTRRLWFGNEAAQRASALAAAETTSLPDGRLAVKVSLQAGSVPLRLILDSGASNVLLSCTEAQCPHMTGSHQRVAATNHGGVAVSVGSLPVLHIGNVCLRNVETVLTGTLRRDLSEDGVLPTHLFSAVYIDSAGGIVRLAP